MMSFNKDMFRLLFAQKVLSIQLLMLFISVPSLADYCPKGEYWVNSHYRSGYIRYDGVAVAPANVRGHCRASPRGYEKWHQGLSSGRPKIWEHKSEKTRNWSTEESERIYDAIALLPQKLLDFNGIKIHRMVESIDKYNPATSNHNDIVLYDLAFKHKEPLEQILAHELAHILYSNLSRELRESFAHAADWEQLLNKTGLWKAKKKKIFIEEDSRGSLNEDFANHIEHFLFKNESLKEKSPKAHKWILDKFGKDFKVQEKK